MSKITKLMLVSVLLLSPMSGCVKDDGSECSTCDVDSDCNPGFSCRLFGGGAFDVLVFRCADRTTSTCD